MNVDACMDIFRKLPGVTAAYVWASAPGGSPPTILSFGERKGAEACEYLAGVFPDWAPLHLEKFVAVKVMASTFYVEKMNDPFVSALVVVQLPQGSPAAKSIRRSIRRALARLRREDRR